MLEKPDIEEELILSRLQNEYGLRVIELTFLPLGADMGTAVYRVVAQNGTAYFLKLRKGFEEISVTIPLFLRSQGVQEIIPPIETKSKQGWADFGEYKMILYPFIEGNDGFERELTDEHKRTLGAALKAIHSAQLPPELKKSIPQETFSPQARESVKSLLALVETRIFDDLTAVKLAEFMKSKRDEISRLIRRTEELVLEVQSQTLDMVLCHSDIHGGNILISDSSDLYIVDWDNPILAPKERDLMFIGGGIDEIWKTKREEAVFYEGYGETEINLSALAYYRYERVIQDLSEIGKQLLLTDEGGADRERSLGWFTSNFEPGQTIEIAEKTVT
ncbi:MAG: phosphotransferase [Anaerolineales bacterium]|nr:phosphotransferase [Anaerolineales bacterium]